MAVLWGGGGLGRLIVGVRRYAGGTGAVRKRYLHDRQGGLEVGLEVFGQLG